jgi:hypothetical protein
MKLWWYLFQELWDGQDLVCRGNLVHFDVQAETIDQRLPLERQDVELALYRTAA